MPGGTTQTSPQSYGGWSIDYVLFWGPTPTASRDRPYFLGAVVGPVTGVEVGGFGPVTGVEVGGFGPVTGVEIGGFSGNFSPGLAPPGVYLYAIDHPSFSFLSFLC